MSSITFSQAVNEAIAEEMRRDETVFLIGEDVAEAGTPFKVTWVWSKNLGLTVLSTRRSQSQGSWGSPLVPP